MSTFRVRQFQTASDFLAHASPWLLQNEAENNLILSLAERLSHSTAGYEPPIYLAAIEAAGTIVGCALRTPKFKLLITQLPLAAVPALIQDVGSVYDAIPAVLGPDQAAERCALLWSEQHGLSAKAGMRQRIYELATLVPPDSPPPGQLRVADHNDLEIAARWTEHFTRDTRVAAPRARDLVADKILSQHLFFWMDRDEHCSMAAWSGTTPNGVRIGYVYTPPEYRGRGYASVCTAAASQRALDAGYRFCFLYTDLANPTSNSIYQRLGYRPIADVVDWVIA